MLLSLASLLGAEWRGDHDDRRISQLGEAVTPAAKRCTVMLPGKVVGGKVKSVCLWSASGLCSAELVAWGPSLGLTAHCTRR